MDEQVWTFTRNGQALEIRRSQTEDGYLLGVSGDGPVRSYFFADLDRLAAFQADFEKFLLGTGWTFLGYSPERRAGHERRHFSRLISDRRRWWTDGTRPIGHPDSDDYDRRSRSRRRQPR